MHVHQGPSLHKLLSSAWKSCPKTAKTVEMLAEPIVSRQTLLVSRVCGVGTERGPTRQRVANGIEMPRRHGCTWILDSSDSCFVELWDTDCFLGLN